MRFNWIIIFLVLSFTKLYSFKPWQKDALTLNRSIPKKHQSHNFNTTDLFFNLYKKLLSTQDGSVCHFKPTCSSYAKQAIEKYGFMKGVLIGSERLIRDHPFTKYSVDRLK